MKYIVNVSKAIFRGFRRYKNLYLIFKKSHTILFRANCFARYTIKFGLSNALKLNYLMSNITGRKSKIIRIKIPGIKHFLSIRTGTTDILVFNQIFLEEDYKLDKIKRSDVKLIIDCGANVGYSPVYFLNKYPYAKVISIEPEKSNFKLLKENIKNYKNAVPIKSAIWSNSTFLKVYNPNNREWGCKVKECSNKDINSFKAITIDSILRKFKETQIDILKMDIEGSEKEVFSKNYMNWLKRTKILMIELHERYSVGCTKTVLDSIKKLNFKKSVSGENLVFIRED